MNRIGTDDAYPIHDGLARLHRAGWSVGDFAAHLDGGDLGWIVSGHNGENLLRAEGATWAEAWRRAVAQGWALGMLRA